MDTQIITKSGVQITQDDIRDIQKRSVRDTLRNVFAIVGVVTVAKLVKDYVDGKGSIVSPPADV